jgi:hypothetical protein
MLSIFRRSLAVLLLATWLHPAWAMDWTPDTTRYLGDPSFLPLGGQVYGTFTYTYSTNRYDYTAGGPVAPVNSWNKQENSYLPSLSYGITDDVSVSADLGWGNIRSQDNYFFKGLFLGPIVLLSPTQGHLSLLSVGPSNPNFALTWRAIDQRSAPVNVDLRADYAPDIFPAREPGPDSTGTLALGGQSGALEASISRETRFLTARGYIGFGYEGQRDIGQPGGQTVLHLDAHPDFALGLQTQARLTPWLALNLGVEAQQATDFGQHYSPGPGFSETVRPGGAITPYAGLVVPLLDNHLAVEFLYQHEFIGNETITSAELPTQKYYNLETNLFLARLMFVFGVR